MTSVARLEKVGSSRLVGASMAFFLTPGCSCWLPGIIVAEVDGPRDDSLRGCFALWLYLVAKPSHVGVNVDRLVCPLHQPLVCNCQTRGHGRLPRVVLSCHCSVHWGLSRDVKLPGRRYLMES
jgi:hypothetical protein